MPIDPRQLEKMAEASMPPRLPPICPQCGYNLTGLNSNRCPECGHVFMRRDVARISQEMNTMIGRFRNWRSRIRAGACVALAAGALLGIGKLVGDPVESLARTATVFGGLIAFGLGMNVLLIYRYPSFVREQITPPPDPLLGLGVGALGLADIGLALLLP
jgi:hypothetical protein